MSEIDYDEGFYEGMRHCITQMIMSLRTDETIHDVIRVLAKERDELYLALKMYEEDEN